MFDICKNNLMWFSALVGVGLTHVCVVSRWARWICPLTLNRVIFNVLGLIFYCCRKRNAKMQKELEEACRDTRGISPEELPEDVGPAPKHSAVPTKATVKFVSEKGGMNVVETYFNVL